MLKPILVLTDTGKCVSLLTERISNGAEQGRDYQVIDFEKAKSDFNKRARDIATLRIQSVASHIGGLFQEFVNFLSDDREEILLEHLDQEVAQKIKMKISEIAGKELQRFKKVIDEVENQDKNIRIHDLCRKLRRLEILIQREVNKRQKSFLFSEVTTKEWEKHENTSSIIEAAELFLAKEYKLPYYFGAKRLITLSSDNIQQFLRLAGSLFEEILTKSRLGRDSELFLLPNRQDAIIKKMASDFLKEIPVMVPNGSLVFRFIDVVGKMCNHE